MTIKNIRELIRQLRTCTRMGSEKDKPEGIHYILISDTLAIRLADGLETFLRKRGK